MAKGLVVEILRGSTDCTNDGLTSKSNGLVFLTAFGFGRDAEVFEPDTIMPPVIVECYCGRLRAVPCDSKGNKLPGQFMFGGNFIHTSDSRFSTVCPYAIPVHDRLE